MTPDEEMLVELGQLAINDWRFGNLELPRTFERLRSEGFEPVSTDGGCIGHGHNFTARELLQNTFEKLAEKYSQSL